MIIGCLTITISALGTPPVTWVDLIPEIMLVAGAALTLGAFLPEAAIALRALKKLAADTDRDSSRNIMDKGPPTAALS